jgi:hypothetical protein
MQAYGTEMSHIGIERLHERDAPHERDRRLMITHLDDGRSDQLIYRVVGESSEWVWSEESGAIEISLSPGRLMGAFKPDSRMGHGVTCRCLCCPAPECVSGSPSADGEPMACAWRPRLEPVVAHSVSSGTRIRPSQWWYTGTTGKSHCYLTA